MEIARSLREILNDKLNENEHGIEFDVFLYHGFKDEMDFYFQEIENTWQEEKKLKIPVVIEEVDGDFLEIPHTTVSEDSVTTTLRIPVANSSREDAYQTPEFFDVAEALDEFRRKYQNEVFFVGGKSYQIAPTSGSLNYSPLVERRLGSLSLRFSKSEASDEEIFDVTDDKVSIKVEDGQLTVYDNGDEKVSRPFVPSKKYEVLFLTHDTNNEDKVRVRILVNGNEYADYISDKVDYEDVNNVSVRPFYGKVTELLFTSSLNKSNIEEYLDGNKSIYDAFEPLEIYTDNFEDVENKGNSSDWYISDFNWNAAVTGEDGEMVINPSKIIPLTNIEQYGSLNFQTFDYTMEIGSSDSIILGNRVKYYLDDQRIYPVNKAYTVSSEGEPEHYPGDTYLSRVFEASDYQHRLNLFIDASPVIQEIIRNSSMSDGVNNKVWNLRVEYPFHTDEDQVLIESVGIASDENSPSDMTVQFVKANTTLEDD